jgi:PAS domain S-box-containing protein
MLKEFLQDRAALYAAGTMTAAERDQFEIILEFHPELRAFATGLLETATAVALAGPPVAGAAPSPGLKGRLFGLIDGRPQRVTPEGMVMCGPDRLVQWVNPAFSEMCGYSLDEVRGKSLGPILQGERTDREVAERMRRAVYEYRPCSETILNYHKNGTPYWVEVSIAPIFDDAGEPVWFVARERELKERAAA